MTRLQTRSHTGPDGTLTLKLPDDFRDAEVEVLVVRATPVEASGWPAGFFEETYGSCQDDPLVRLPQGDAEVREPIQ